MLRIADAINDYVAAEWLKERRAANEQNFKRRF
jgi:hypothetical protein